MAHLRQVITGDEQHNGADARLHVALDNMPGALVYTDEDLNIVFCNERFKEMYPAPQELLQPGRRILISCAIWPTTAITAKAMPTRWSRKRVESLRNPTGKSFEDHTPDGRWYRIRRRRVAGGGTVTVMTDITEQSWPSRI